MAHKRVNLPQVNKAIAEKFVNIELVKGKGYFYFTGNGVDYSRYSNSVYTPRIGDLSLEQWLKEAEDNAMPSAHIDKGEQEPLPVKGGDEQVATPHVEEPHYPIAILVGNPAGSTDCAKLGVTRTPNGKLRFSSGGVIDVITLALASLPEDERDVVVASACNWVALNTDGNVLKPKQVRKLFALVADDLRSDVECAQVTQLGNDLFHKDALAGLITVMANQARYEEVSGSEPRPYRIVQVNGVYTRLHSTNSYGQMVNLHDLSCNIETDLNPEDFLYDVIKLGLQNAGFVSASATNRLNPLVEPDAVYDQSTAHLWVCWNVGLRYTTMASVVLSYKLIPTFN